MKDEPMTESNTEKDIKINLARQHIIEGLLKARRDADNIIEILITEEDPKLYLVADLLYSPHQAQSILELNRPINQIDEEFLVAEQNKLKEIEAELKARHNKEDAPDQKTVR
jgi:DNA gyrase/topoisomerase IV subunit A